MAKATTGRSQSTTNTIASISSSRAPSAAKGEANRTDGLDCFDVSRPTMTKGLTRRSHLLTGTAFAGGIFALMMAANPQSSYASCTYTNMNGAGDGSVSCATTTTTNGNVTTGAGPTASSVRYYEFSNAGNVTGNVTLGSTVNGDGLAISTTTSLANLTFTNNGNITLSGTPGNISGNGSSSYLGGFSDATHGGTALYLSGAGGTISYTGNGNVTGGNVSGTLYDGIQIVNTGTGAVLFGNSTTPITPTLTGANGLAISTANGNQDVYIQGGTIVAAGNSTIDYGNGILLSARNGSAGNGTGNINLSITGNTTITTSGIAGAGNNTVYGVWALANAGNITIASSATIGTSALPLNAGIVANDSTGTVTIEQTGGTIYAVPYTGSLIPGANSTTNPGFGIAVNSVADGTGSGAVTITTDAGSAIQMNGGTGIYGASTGNSVTVTVNGTIDNPDVGVNATGVNSAVSVSVGGSGSIAANDQGIFAQATGTGAVTVTTDNGSSITESASNGAVTPVGGIVTSATSGPTSIDVGGTISATGTAADAIHATSTTGTIGISTGLNSVSSTTGNAIFASASGAANISATTDGGLVSGVTGINLTTAGAGTITVSVGSGGVTGSTGYGVVTSAADGFTSITSAGLIQTGGTAAAISATASGTGAITIITTGTTTSSGGDAIDANTNSGAISVTAATVTGAAGGINATSTSGPVTVITTGNVQGGNASGDTGIIAGNGTSGNVVVTTQDGGTVSAYTGINASATGAGNVTVNTSQGGLVTGLGDSGIIASAASGFVSVTAGPVTGNSSGISATTSAGGNIVVTTTDSVTGTHAIGINAAAADGGNVTVTTGGAVTGGTYGINATTAVAAGNVTVTSTAGTVAGGSNFGINATAFTGNVSVTAAAVSGTGGINAATGGSGAIVVATSGNITGGSGIGIATSAATGSTLITTAAGTTVSGSNGIQAIASGAGSITGNIGGTVTDSSGYGIYMNSAGGTIYLTTAGGNVSGTTGIDLTTTGSGNITLSAGTGEISGTAGNAITTTANTGFTSITTAGLVTAAGFNHAGISATATTGAITIDATGTVKSTLDSGIVATTTSGPISITSANVTAFTNGINASSTSGNVTVTTSAGSTIANGLGTGIIAGNGTTGNVQVATGGTVLSGFTGINATATGGGNVTVDTTAGSVTSLGDSGIIASSGSGFVKVASDSVTALTNGINASSTSGNVTVTTSAGSAIANGLGTGIIAGNGTTGNVQVTTGGTVLSGLTGINATATGGGTVIITTNGTVTGTSGDAIDASTGAGNVQITTFGAVASTGTGDGIAVTSSTGNVVVTTNAAVSGDPAIIISTGGTINVNASVGPVTGTTDGIETTETGTSATSITVGSNVAVSGTTGDGIHATSAGGDISVAVDLLATVTGGDHGIDAWGGGGNVTVATDGLVTSTTGSAIKAATNGSGFVVVTADAPVSSTDGSGIHTYTVDGFNSVTANNTVSGATGIHATSSGIGNVTVVAAANVTGTDGDGIRAHSSGGNDTVTVGPNVTVTGTNQGASGISAATATGAITVNVDTGAMVTNAIGIGVRLTQTGTTGSAVLNNSGTVSGAGNHTWNPVIAISSAGGTTTINNASGALITAVGNPALAPGLIAIDSSGNGGVTINNNSGGLFITGLPQYGLVGEVQLAGATGKTNIINNQGLWDVFGANSFGAGTNTIINSGVIAINDNPVTGTTLSGSPTTFTFKSGGINTLVNAGTIFSGGDPDFLNVTAVKNNAPGIFNVGSAPGAVEITNFSSTASVNGAFSATGAPVQTVTNSGTFNILALQPTSALGPYNGALNFYGGNGSSFNNTNAAGGAGAGGTINMQVDGGVPTNAVTLNTLSMAGTSDFNYTYTWAGTLGTANYNFVGSTTAAQPQSTLAVDTFLGAPGTAAAPISTSDRLVVGGNISGTTQLNVNNTNPGPGAYNPLGITVAAVEGTGSNNIVVNKYGVTGLGTYVNFGPLGAIAPPGLFIDPLIYVPGGATSTGGLPNGNAYKFFGVPEPFLFNLTVAHTAVQTLWQQTAFQWEDRQNEVRGYLRDGIYAGGQRLGGGAEMSMKSAEPDVTNPGVWMKAIGADMTRTSSVNYASALGLPVLGGLPNVDNSYNQTIYGAVGGFDFGKEGFTSPADSLVFGVMGGYITSQVAFDSPNMIGAGQTTHFSISGGTVGVSADYVNRGFFIDNLVKADFLTLAINGIPASTGAQAVNANVFGDLGNIGFHFQRGQYFVEPLGSWMVSWDHIGTVTLPGLTANFGTGTAADVGGGFRAGGVVMNSPAHYLEASVTARLWDRLQGDTNVSFLPTAAVPGGTAFTLNDQFNGPFGEVALGLDWFNRGNGWSAFVNLDSWFNGQFTMYAFKGGVRYQF